MSSRLSQLIVGVLAAMLAGFLAYPLFYAIVKLPAPTVATSPAPSRTASTEPEMTVPTGVVIDDSGSVATNEGDQGDELADTSEEDDSWAADDGEDESSLSVNGEQSTDPYMPARENFVAEEQFSEDDIPVDPEQDKFAPVSKGSRNGNIERNAKRLAKLLEKEETKARRTPFVRQEFTPDRWMQPQQVYADLSARVLEKLGKLDDETAWKYLEDPR